MTDRRHSHGDGDHKMFHCENNLSDEPLFLAFQSLKRSLYHMVRTQKISGLRHSEFIMLIRIHDTVTGSNKRRKKDGLPPLPGVQSSTLSKMTGCSASSVSQVIGALEKNGLVERITSREDRRAVFVRLTDKGRETLKTAPNPAMDRIREAAAMLGEEKNAQLVSLLNEFGENLDRLNREAEAGETDDSGRSMSEKNSRKLNEEKAH